MPSQVWYLSVKSAENAAKKNQYTVHFGQFKRKIEFLKGGICVPPNNVFKLDFQDFPILSWCMCVCVVCMLCVCVWRGCCWLKHEAAKWNIQKEHKAWARRGVWKCYMDEQTNGLCSWLCQWAAVDSTRCQRVFSNNYIILGKCPVLQ